MKKSQSYESVNQNNGPLKGIKIVDMSTVVMGPYATQILGDLGADIVKIENIGGDIMRYAGKSPTPLMGPVYMRCNRNKKSLELDLAKPSAKKAVNSLIKKADIFITNIRLSGLERLDYNYEKVKEINPNIIYVHCVGFGSDGPYGGRQAYDDLVQAASGVTELISQATGSPEPRYIPSIIADKTAALHAVYATIAGLFHRERSGEGQFIEVPMFESFVSFNMVENLYGPTFVPSQGPMVYPRSIEPNRKPFPTKDGFIGIVPYNDEHWFKLFELAGSKEVMDDPKFLTFKDRTENISQLYAKVGEVTKKKSTQEWVDLLEKAQIPYMPVQKMSEILKDDHLTKIGFFEQRKHPTEGTYISLKHPVKFSETPAVVLRDPPKVGQDNFEILSDLGYNEEQINEITEKSSTEVLRNY